MLVPVMMDTGVFNWLREVVEAKHRISEQYKLVAPWYPEVAGRAHSYFSTAGTEQADVLAAALPKKKIRRKRLQSA